MKAIFEFSDDRLKSWCVHCGRWLSNVETNVDHIPSKSFLADPWPDNIPTIPVCRGCNSSFSRDEAYMVAFLSSAMAGTTDPEKQVIPSAKRILEKSQPLRAEITRCASYTTIGGEERLVWKPDIERVKNVVIKNARGHAFFEIGEPIMHAPASVGIVPLASLTPEQRDQFEETGWGGSWPEVGSRMMTRMVTGQDLTEHGWVVVQEGVYRYSVAQTGLMTVKSVMYEYLGTEVYWDYQ